MEINWIPPVIPKFDNVKDQFMWYLKKFIRFSSFLGHKAQIKSMEKVTDDFIEKTMGILGDDMMIGKAWEIKQKYGDGLLQESMVMVSKVVAELSQGLTVSDITNEMKQFTDYLESDNLSRKRFFSYWGQLNDIIESIQNNK